MKRPRLPRYVHAFIDRHGKPRYYLRRPGFKRVPLPGLPYSPEFMEAHAFGMAGNAPKIEIGASRTRPGTVDAAVIAYYGRPSFTGLAPQTRNNRRAILERFRAEHGDKRIALLQRTHIVHMLGKKKP